MTGASELVVARGRDAVSYLQGQMTQDLSDLTVGSRTWSLLLDPNGTIVAMASLTMPEPDVVVLEVPTGVAAPAIARLRRFAIREEVDFSGPEPGADGDARLRDERARIDAAVPGPRELAVGLVPHALDAAALARAVSFTKGCYPGQELVARMQSRGASPPYVLRRAAIDVEASPGDRAGAAEFDGQVTSIVADPDASGFHALCVLHRRDAAGGEVVVHTGSGDAQARLG